MYGPSGLLFDRSVSGSAPSIELSSSRLTPFGGADISWRLKSGVTNSIYRVRFSPDGGQSWQVLALQTTSTSFLVTPNLLEGASSPLLEIQVTDGVRASTQIYSLPAR